MEKAICAKVLVYRLEDEACPEKSVSRLTVQMDIALTVLTLKLQLKLNFAVKKVKNHHRITIKQSWLG